MIKLTVTDINGTAHLIEVPTDSEKNIIELAADQGIELPYSCMSGACFACCGEVKKGGEHLDLQKTGEQLIDVEPDEILCCIGGIKSEAFVGEDKEVEIQMMN